MSRPTFQQAALSEKADCPDVGGRTRIDNASVPGVKRGMRILGMTLWPENVSDEQYVERVRKGLRMMRRMRYFLAAIGLVTLGMVISMIYMLIDMLKDFGNLEPVVGRHLPPPSQQLIYATFYIAILGGGFCGFLLYQALFHVGIAFADYRKEKLLVDCWDALSDAEKGRLRQRSR